MSESIEKIEQQLGDATDTGQKIKLLLALGRRLFRSDTMRALDCAEQSLALAETIGDKIKQAESHMGIGYCKRSLADYDASINHHNCAAALWEEVGDYGSVGYARTAVAILYDFMGKKKEAMAICIQALADFDLYNNTTGVYQALLTISSLYQQFGFTTQALDVLYRLRDLCEKQGNKRILAQVYHGIANVLSDIYNYGTVLTYYTKSLELRKEGGDKWGEALTLLNIGGVYLRLKEPENARNYLFEAHTLFHELGDTAFEGTALSDIGVMWKELGDSDAALRCFQQAFAIAEETKHADSCARACGNIARMYRIASRYNEAIVYMEKGLEIGRAMDSPFLLRELAREAEYLYAAAGAEEQVVQMRQLYLDSERRVIGPSLTETIADVEQQYTKKEIAVYQRQNDVLRDEIEQRERDMTTAAIKLSQKNEFIRYVNRQIVQIIRNGRAGRTAMLQELLQQMRTQGDNSDQQKFDEQVAYVQSQFVKDLSQRNPALTPTEVKVCTLLRMGLSSKQIAALLFIDARTIEGHRYRIRKKLGLAEKANLTLYLSSL